MFYLQGAKNKEFCVEIKGSARLASRGYIKSVKMKEEGMGNKESRGRKGGGGLVLEGSLDYEVEYPVY